MRRRSRRVNSDPVIAVGWIFTDLLLGLVVILLASQVVVPKKTLAETPRPKPSPTVKTLATMEKKPKFVELQVDADGLLNERPAAVEALNRQLVRRTKDLRNQQREAAMVLVWGYAPESGTGQQIARKVSKNLSDNTGALFKKATKRDLWHGGFKGRVQLELYLYQQERT